MIIGSYWKDWEITGELGSGSYGKVYRIRREGFEGFTEECALKVIRIPKDQSEYVSALSKGLTIESVDRYYESVVSDLSNEIALMSHFKGNSNIVSFEDYEVEKMTDSFGWTIYIRMELLTPLNTILRERELDNDEVIRIGIDICKALELCESENVIHRDIKEENIFLSSHGDYKLGDFGIAKQLDGIYFNQTKIGTPSHMAPEVYRGEQYTSSVDIYSLGIVLYRLLNHGRNPFMPPYPESIGINDERNDEVRRTRGDAYPPPANAPKDLSTVILTACAPRSSDRYPSARKMRLALEAVRDGKKPPVQWRNYLKYCAAGVIIALIFALSFSNIRDKTGTEREMPEETQTENAVSADTEDISDVEAEAEPISFPEYSDNVISVSNSDEFLAALSSASSGTTIEVSPGEYDLNRNVEISTPGIRILGVGNSKPVICSPFYVSVPKVMFENISIVLRDDSESADHHSGIVFEDTQSGTCYLKDTDIEELYYSDYILYGITVYSPLEMQDCRINVNDPDGNGNIAVGIGDEFNASGCTFESNDVALNIFGDGSSKNSHETIEALLAANTFVAPTRVVEDVSY